jgi:hypothetical protein
MRKGDIDAAMDRFQTPSLSNSTPFPSALEARGTARRDPSYSHLDLSRTLKTKPKIREIEKLRAELERTSKAFQGCQDSCKGGGQKQRLPSHSTVSVDGV